MNLSFFFSSFEPKFFFSFISLIFDDFWATCQDYTFILKFGYFWFSLVIKKNIMRLSNWRYLNSEKQKNNKKYFNSISINTKIYRKTYFGTLNVALNKFAASSKPIFYNVNNSLFEFVRKSVRSTWEKFREL